MKVKVPLKLHLLTTKLKARLSQILEEAPTGSTLHIEFYNNPHRLFTNLELEEQIRSCFGANNRNIFFDGETIQDWDKVVNLKATGESHRSYELLNSFLRGYNNLDRREVPSEVLLWLSTYKKRHDRLLKYAAENF